MLVLISGVKFHANISPSLPCPLSNTLFYGYFRWKNPESQENILLRISVLLNFSRYRGVQRGKIRKKFNLGHQNSLEADRDFLNYALRLVSTLPLDNRHINIHKSRKVTKVYCLSSQRTTRQLKFKTNIDGKMESDTQSALAENRFYKTSDHFW